MSVITFSATGTKSTTVAKLPKDIFDQKIESHDLLHQVFVAQHAALRSNSAKTLDRGEVRGGGKKPWKQKGTGRARHGSIRSPIWRGGGVTFGPSTDRNYTKKVTTAAKQKALRQVLTLCAKDGSLSIIKSFVSKDGKTAPMESLLKKLNLARPLVVVIEKRDDVTVQATRNLKDLDLVTASYLNVYRLANARHILLTEGAIAVIEAGPKQTKPETKE